MNAAVRNVRKKPRVKISTKKMLNLYSYKTPNIVIVGDKSIKRKVPNIEKNFNLMVVFTDADQLKAIVNAKTIAIIIDEKEVKKNIKKYLEKLLKDYKLLPIFYLSRNLKKPAFYTSLYGQGLQGVINWLEESKILHGLIIETLKPHPNAVGRTKGDKRLSDVIKSHLTLIGVNKSIKVKVVDGFAFLQGAVNSLFDKKTIEEETSKILGVKSTIVKDIKIKNTKKTTDRELERKIKMYMGHIAGEKKRSMSVKVKNKVVTLMGMSSSHSDVLDIEKFAMKQPGVQDVIRLVKYQPALAFKHAKKAKLLEKRIMQMFNGVKNIRINVYGAHAEVSGTVKMSTHRALIEQYLLQVLPVKKIVNKIFISKRS